MNMAVASFTRFRPSLIPAPENNVRKILFDQLIFKWIAISLLLHPAPVTEELLVSRSNLAFVEINHRFLDSISSVLGRRPTPNLKHLIRHMFALNTCF
jgi:hypothetical protein